MTIFKNVLWIVDIDYFEAMYPIASSKQRWDIYRRDNYTCVYCHNPGIKTVIWAQYRVKPPVDVNPRATGMSLHHDLACKDAKDELVMITLDHVIPKSKGGFGSYDNLVTACCICNQRKADRHVDDFMSMIKKNRKVLI